MFEITFLGTAAAVPTVERGLPALLVDFARHRFLVDCGEGTQRQILRSGLGLRRLDKVLLTHGHLDHLLGLGGLAGTLGLLRASQHLSVFAGAHALRLAAVLLEQVVWPASRPPIRLAFVPIEAGCFYESGKLRVHAFPVRHTAPDSYGFLFERRPFRPALEGRMDALGVPRGPERSRLADGHPVRLADGRRVDPDEVLGPERPGCRVAVIGDTESVDDLVDPVRGADLLVVEGTFLDADARAARERSHLTVGDAARLAREAGVGRLWLTHLSSRYPAEAVAAAAASAFPGARVASDFDRVVVPDESRSA